MSNYIQIKTHPIRFLLYLEWILLLLVTVAEVAPEPTSKLFRLSPINLFCIASFFALGLRLPQVGKLDKLIYTLVEIGIIFWAGIVGGIRLFPVLYLILTIRSYLIFAKWGRLVIMVLAFVLFLLNLIYRVQTFTFPFRPAVPERLEFILLSFAIFFGLVLLFLFLLVNTILSERKSREELALINEQLRQYALKIEDLATLQECNRIARDIHDYLGHSLTALNLQIETAIKLWRSHPTKAEYFLGEAKKLGSTALKEVRESVSQLQSDPLKGRGLQEAIAHLTQSFHSTTGISPNCSIYLINSIPVELKVSIYRILQEALTNICKHAEATYVEISMMTTATDIYLIIDDNGKGFNLKQNTTGFGLQGMRDRARSLGGQLEIETSPRKGCRITVSFPLRVANS